MAVLEAFLVATIFLAAAAYATLQKRGQGPNLDDPLELATSDALDALVELRGPEGTPLVDALVRDAWRCAETPSSAACTSGAHAAAASRLRAYLPAGAGYEFALIDHAIVLPLGPSAGASGLSVGASATYVPRWSYAIVAPVVSCHDPGLSAKVEMVFVQSGNSDVVRGVSLTGNATAPARAGGVWSASTTPSGAAVTAAASSPLGSVSGQTMIPACSVLGHSGPLEEALSQSSYSVTPLRGDAVSPGRDLAIRHDLSPATGLPNVTLQHVRLDVYTPSMGDAPTWTVPLGSGLAGTSSWRVPPMSLHGCYPTALRAVWTVTGGEGAGEVETSRLGRFCVTFPDGHLPPVPMYRLTLRAWMTDWSE